MQFYNRNVTFSFALFTDEKCILKLFSRVRNAYRLQKEGPRSPKAELAVLRTLVAGQADAERTLSALRVQVLAAQGCVVHQRMDLIVTRTSPSLSAVSGPRIHFCLSS